MPFPWRFASFDATGTLIGLRRGIGATYVQHWERLSGQTLPPTQRAAAAAHVDAQFPVVYRRLATTQPNFGRSMPTTTTSPNNRDKNHHNHHRTPWPPLVPDSDSALPWWSSLIFGALPPALVAQIPDPATRGALAASLYAEYGTAEAWRVLDDVRPALEALRADGVRLAVISDFDARLPGLLADLGLAPFFSVITTSWAHGATKPAPSIFDATHRQLRALDGDELEDENPSRRRRIVHIGDHVRRDYAGARAAGFDARLIVRGPKRGTMPPEEVPAVHVLSDLRGLVQIRSNRDDGFS